MALAAIVGFWVLSVLLIFEFPMAPLPVLVFLFRVKMLAAAVILAFVGVRTLDRMGTAGSLFLASTATHLGIGLLIWLQFSSLDWADIETHAKWKISGVVLFAAVVVGARAVIDVWGVETVFRGVLAVLAASAAVVVALPAWASAGLPIPPGLNLLNFRYLGAFTNPIISAFAGCATASLGIALLGRRRSGLIGFSALSLGFASMLLGFSRGPALGFVALLVFFVLRGPGLRRFLLLVWMAVVAACLALLVTTLDLGTIVAPRQAVRLVEIGQILAGDFSSLGLGARTGFWAVAWQEYVQSPVVGHGLGEMLQMEGAPLVTSPFSELQGVVERHRRGGAHNHFLAMGGEAGIVPMALYALALTALVRGAWTLPRSYPVDAALGLAVPVTFLAVAESNIDGMSPVIFVTGVACAFVADASDKHRRRAARAAAPAGADRLSGAVQGASRGSAESSPEA